MKRVLLLTPLLIAAMGSASAQCPAGETEVTMTIATDMYGSETTWTVTGPGGSPTYGSGGPYSNYGSPNAYPQTPVSFCVPDGTTLTVTVNDAYGDGMCCAYGNGSWTISVGGVNVSTGGTFGSVQTATVVLGTDAGVASTMPAVIAAGNTNITGTVKNNGTVSINSFTVAYAIDGGLPQAQTFNSTIAPGATYAFTHDTPWNATVGNHTLNLTLSGVDGDQIAANNSVAGALNVATGSVERTVVLEQFTSSTCPPCASLNVNFAPFLTSMQTNHAGSHFSAVKYHMHYPPPGNDPTYNAHSNTRHSYYGVQGIPSLFLDGMSLGSYGADVWNTAQAKPSFVDLSATAVIDGTTLTVNAAFTPFADFTSQHKLHIVATENSHNYQGTTSQNEFHYMHRRMLPNASGTNYNGIVAGQTYEVTQSHTFALGGVAQNNHNLWEDMSNVTVIVFLQNNSTKEILQGQVVIPTIGIGVAEVGNELRLGLMPNPSNGTVSVGFDMPESGTAFITVHDQLGALVHSQSIAAGIGMQRATLDLQHLSNGLYHVGLVAGNARASQKLLLEK